MTMTAWWQILAEGLLDARVSEWHASDSPLLLHEYLGMTWEQYVLWLSPRA